MICIGVASDSQVLGWGTATTGTNRVPRLFPGSRLYTVSVRDQPRPLDTSLRRPVAEARRKAPEQRWQTPQQALIQQVQTSNPQILT